MGICVRLALLAVLGQLLMVTSPYASTMYVTDMFEIVLRSEKDTGTGKNIVQLLPTGTPVEVIDMDDSWATIQLANGGIAYALKRYLISRVPHKLQAERLQKEVEQQRARLSTLTEQLTTLRSGHRDLQQASTDQQSQLAEVTKKYEQLRRDASQYLQLKADFSDLQRVYNQSQQELTELNNAHLLLKKSRNLLWFLGGAGVMLTGWIIGLITERFRGRRKRQGGSSYQLPH